MIDVIPKEDNRFAVLVGRILHPYLLPIPTTVAILRGLPFIEALGWAILVFGIVVVPGALFAAVLERRGKYLYQRRTRQPLYLVGGICILLCMIVVIGLDAPRPLIASVGALILWLPLQGAINTWVTKISGHASVAMGCYCGLLLLGRLETPLVQLTLLLLVVLTLWARVVTHHHTIRQVVLGVLVGALPVLMVFPLVLG